MRADDATARSLLVQAILSSNVKEQVELIGKLETVESDVVPEVLNAWRDGAVFRSRECPTDRRSPSCERTAKRYASMMGIPSKRLRRRPVETTTKLRRAMKSALDVLSIAGTDPQARRAAVTKLGMTQNAAYLPIFEARLAVEKDPAVVTSLHEAIAITRLAGTDAAAKNCGD